MKKVVSQVKTIKADLVDMAAQGLSRRPDAGARAEPGGGNAAGEQEYGRDYIVDDLQPGTLVRKTAVHLGLLADDGIDLISRINPLRGLRSGSDRGGSHPAAPHYEVRYRQKIDVTARDGVSLCANLFAPVATAPGQSFPAIILINSWLMDKHQYVMQARRFARNGYLVMSYSARGWGRSGGVVDVGGPDDMGDLTAVIDWLLANAPVDADNVGCAGISYGSGMSLLGAAHDRRIKTVVCMSGWTDLLEAFWSQQTPREFCARFLVSSSDLAARTDDSLSFLLGSLLKNQNLDQVKAWAQLRSPVTYMDEYNRRKPPIYIVQNFQDELFQPNALLDFYSQLEGPKRIDLNLGTHASAEISGILGLSNYLWKEAHLWFDHWLKGELNGVMDRPPVSCQYEQHSRVRLSLGRHEGSRRFLEDWPSSLLAERTFALLPAQGDEPGGKMLENGGPRDAVKTRTECIRSGLGPSESTAGLPFISSTRNAHLNMPLKLDMDRVNPELAVVFDSEPFPETRLILGNPRLSLRVGTSRPQLQLIAYLYDCDEGGSGRLITHGPVTRHCVQPDEPFDICIELVTTCYEVEEGRHLVLVLDTSDLQYQVPTRDEFEVTIYYPGAEIPQLKIPFAAQ